MQILFLANKLSEWLVSGYKSTCWYCQVINGMVHPKMLQLFFVHTMKVHEVQNNTGAHQKSMGPKTTLDPTESEWGPNKKKLVPTES